MKLRLTVILSGQAFQQVELENFKKVRLGRAEDCEIHLDNAAVSRYHCDITRHEGDILRIRDMGSNNGTVLNGVKITTHGLRHGDVITIGKLTIQVEIEGLRQKSRRHDRAPAGVMTVETDREAFAKAQREAENRVRGYLIFPDGDEGRQVPLEELRYVFGKDKQSDVHVGGFFAPRLSAVILREDFGFRIIDLSPKGNAVWVNGSRATDVRLGHDDALRIRRVRCTFRTGRAT